MDPEHPDREELSLAHAEPVFNAPRVVLLQTAVLIGVHVARTYVLPEEADQWLLGIAAFIPSRYTGETLPGGEVAGVTSFVTHALLHVDFSHLLINCGWLLAFGSIVARRIDVWRYLLLCMVSAIAGAGLFLAMNWGMRNAMVGVSGAVAGLMGAAVRFIFRDDGRSYGAACRRPTRCMTIRELMADRRARLMIGSWLGLNLLFGLVLGQLFTADGIAWEAHLGGFLAGLLLFPWFDRSGTSAQSMRDETFPLATH